MKLQQIIHPVNGFLVSAAKKSSGKTIVSLGIGAALKNRGLTVQSYKKGPDYIDPNWHSRATGRDCLNLDFRLQSHQEITNCFEHYRAGADVVYIEGNKGLFDGMDLEGSDSNAALAQYLGLPVILVIDCEGVTRGIAPLLQGYEQFDAEVKFAGVILNRVAGPRHEQKLIASVERYTDLNIIGAVRRNAKLNVDERHLGLVPSNESTEADQIIQAAAILMEEQLDINLLQQQTKVLSAAVAQQQPEAAKQGVSTTHKKKAKIKLGVARDAAFGFYYQDDLDAFRAMGVEVCEFDTINDNSLPDVDALFLGGGFPETHLQELSDNLGMRESIRQFIEANGPVYAECGGLMYLCRSISYQGKKLDMVAALAADVMMQARPVGRGYAQITPSKSHPWHQGDFAVETQKTGDQVDCHEFHYSHLENIDPSLAYAYSVERGYGITGKDDGLVYKNVLANYSHQRNAEQNPWVSAFIQFIQSR